MVLTISVLFVDDEPGLLDIGKLFLERTSEFTVTTASSASVALDLLKSNGIQAIVSDYQMPGMDGIGFLKRVRAMDKAIPFILFTGKGREEIAIEAFENGADFYLQKGGEPVSQFAELMHKIKAAVDHRQNEAQVTTLNRLYTVLSATNKAIVRIHDKNELLNEICRIAVEKGGFTMVWAGIANPVNRLIEPVAVHGMSEGYLDRITISIDDGPRSLGPTSTAFRDGTYNVCNDIATDERMKPVRESALKQGYHSLAAFPFALDTKNAGVITFYASVSGYFTDQIVRLLDEQSSDLSFAFVTFDHEEQRITAENDLKTSELRYRRLFQTAQDAILILDGDTGEVIDANKFILDMLGYPLEYFVGKHLWELGFIKDKSIAQHAFTELKTNGYIRYEDIPLEKNDGQGFNVEFISNVYLVGDTKIIQCNIRDITDKKLVQDALRASETRYRRLFETAQDGILILDEETGTIVDANKFILEMLGYPLEYFVGKHLWELGFIKDKSIAQHAFTELKMNGYIRYENLPLETKDGQGINVEFISNVYLVGDKKILQCNIRDITARKLAEDALAESDARLNSILQGSPMPQFVIDKDHRVISWNKAIEEYSGVHEAEVLGTRDQWKAFYATERPVLADLLVDEKIELLPEWYQGTVTHSRLVEGAYETTGFLQKIGVSGKWLYFTAAPIRNADGAIIGAVETLEDITERKSAEEALLQANKKLTILNNVTWHDILNQLMGLRTYLELSKREIKDSRILAYIDKEEKVTEVIQWQIEFTRNYHDIGAQAPKWQILSDIISLAIRQLNPPGIGVNVAVNGAEIFADPLIEKVFYNLMENSLRHGDHVTHMDYSVRETENDLIIIYCDDGVGITGDDKKKLFQKGFGKHTGLGLFLSKEILAITGISITENGEPGKGVRFEITVPKGVYRFEDRT